MDLRSVLSRWENMQLFLVGHTHRWIDMRETETLPHMVLGATRYDEDNFLVFDFELDGSGYSIPDYDKAGWWGVCADTWSYTGSAGPEAGAPPETGDCGP